MTQDGIPQLPQIIVLSGTSSFGKTTIAKLLQQQLGSVYLHMAPPRGQRHVANCLQKSPPPRPIGITKKYQIHVNQLDCEFGSMVLDWIQKIFKGG